jgi:hypothetical protein
MVMNEECNPYYYSPSRAAKNQLNGQSKIAPDPTEAQQVASANIVSRLAQRAVKWTKQDREPRAAWAREVLSAFA